MIAVGTTQTLPASKILVVDDDASVREAVKAILNKNYDIATASNALQAYRYLSENKVALVLLDIKMPKICGVEALKEIKNNHPETVVVMMTAYALDDTVKKAMSLGASGFIMKPFDVYELRNFVDGILSRIRK